MAQNKSLNIAGSATLLAAFGYPRTFVKKILPAWWDASAAATSAGALEYALILRERFGLRSSFSPEGTLQIDGEVPGARFKKRATTELPALAASSRLGAALGRMALRIAPPAKSLQTDVVALRAAVVAGSGGKPVTLETLVRYCWKIGIPVVHLQLLPSKAAKMAGMVMCHKNRYAIVLAHSFRENARQAFVVAHELGHIILGHVVDDGVLVDEAIDTVEETLRRQIIDAEEQAADMFALALLRGPTTLPEVRGLGMSPATLAASAAQSVRGTTVDPAQLILAYAHHSRDWRTATQAMRFLQGANEAASLLRTIMSEEADFSRLTQDERDYIEQMQWQGGSKP